jgi:hypothetical protein
MAKTDKVFADGLRVDLLAGFPVSEYTTSAAWYERLLGCPPAFLPNNVEAVWELAEHRYIFIKLQPEHAGHAFNLFFLSDLDRFIAQIAERGLIQRHMKPFPMAFAKSRTLTPTGVWLGSVALL